MAISEIFRSTSFRLSIAFALVVTASTFAVFSFVYWQVAMFDTHRLRVILIDEASKAAVEPIEQVERELARRLTRDLRQIEYVGLFDAGGNHLYGNVAKLPPVPVDGKAHAIEVSRPNGAQGDHEPVICVAQRRPDGGVLVLGRSLYEVYTLRRIVLQALAVGIGPMILLILMTGAYFSLRASRRLQSIHTAINRVIQGDLRERLPVGRTPDAIDEVLLSVNLMLDEIARLMNQVKNVGDNIAHDLRTPLSVMRMRLERGVAAPSEKELRAATQQALSDLDRALMTVTALLRISEIESGLRRGGFAKIDLSKVCHDVFDLYEPLAEDKSITMSLDAPAVIPISGDADLLREAIGNLIDNAIKFTQQGGSVAIVAKATPDGPFVSVTDNGPGISADERDKIFKRFYRSAGANNTPGNGLGLSMAATIAELHGLHLQLADKYPGASFEMTPHTTPASVTETVAEHA